MWEGNLIRRIVPAFVFIIMAIIMYIVGKYIIVNLVDAFNTSGYDPTTWGLAYWIMALFPVFIVWHYLLKAWTHVSGRVSWGSGGNRNRPRKPPQFPTEQDPTL